MRPLEHLLLCCLLCTVAACDHSEADWSRAKQAHTQADYRDFASKYPESPHLDEASAAIDRLDWEEARLTNTIESHENYLRRHQSGPHAEEASAALLSLREEHDWTGACRTGNISDLEEFILQYPNSPHNEGARFKIRGLHWSQAKLEDSRMNVIGVYIDQDTEHLLTVRFSHRASSVLGSAQIDVGLFVNVRGAKDPMDVNPKMLATNGRLRILRNGADVFANGKVVVEGADGINTTTEIAGIIWAADGNLWGSWVFSYDTHIGVSDDAQFEGLESDPVRVEGKPIAAFQIRSGGFIVFQP